MTATSTLLTIGTELLTAAVAALGGRAPDRQYVATGLVSFDGCDQITTSWGPNGLYPTNPFPGRTSQVTRCVVVPAAEFVVECTRCVPVIEGDVMPDPAVIQAAHAEILADAETLFCGLLAAAQAGTLFGDARLFSFSGATPYGPSGGQGGCRLPIVVQTSCP